MNLHAARSERLECALRENRHRFEPDDIFRTPRRVDLARRDHGGDAAVQAAVDPAKLILARRPVTTHRVHVAVDQAWGERRSPGIDRDGRAATIDILFVADRLDDSVH